jgi:hypothetical protein
MTSRGRNLHRLNAELLLLEQAYGEVRVSWPASYQWVMIQDYPLPLGYNKPTTNLIVIIPENYGYGPALQYCFVDRDLRRNGHLLPHYFLEGDVAPGASQFYQKDWAFLCVHPEKWDPKRHNILTYLRQVDLFLSDPQNRRWG